MERVSAVGGHRAAGSFLCALVDGVGSRLAGRVRNERTVLVQSCAERSLRLGSEELRPGARAPFKPCWDWRLEMAAWKPSGMQGRWRRARYGCGAAAAPGPRCHPRRGRAGWGCCWGCGAAGHPVTPPPRCPLPHGTLFLSAPSEHQQRAYFGAGQSLLLWTRNKDFPPERAPSCARGHALKGAGTEPGLALKPPIQHPCL